MQKAVARFNISQTFQQQKDNNSFYALSRSHSPTHSLSYSLFFLLSVCIYTFLFGCAYFKICLNNKCCHRLAFSNLRVCIGISLCVCVLLHVSMYLGSNNSQHQHLPKATQCRNACAHTLQLCRVLCLIEFVI